MNKICPFISKPFPFFNSGYKTVYTRFGSDIVGPNDPNPASRGYDLLKIECLKEECTEWDVCNQRWKEAKHE